MKKLLLRKSSMEEYGYSLVTIHPQEFSAMDGLNFQNKVDTEQAAELKLLIDSIRNEGYTIVTVSQLANYSAVPEFSGLLLYAALALPLAAIIIAYRKKGRIG